MNMAIDLLRAAWAIDLSPTNKLVLVSFADQANDHGVCWPSVAYLMSRTGLCERSVRKAIGDLEQAGYLVSEKRVAQSSVYTVTLPETVEFRTQDGAPNAGKQVHSVQGGGVRGAGSRTPTIEVEPSLNQHHGEPTQSAPSRFGEFWSDYPTSRKVAKSKCFEHWRLKKLDAIADQIIDHVRAMKANADAWKRGYEPAPLTYLHQRRWEDGAPEPTNSRRNADGSIPLAI